MKIAIVTDVLGEANNGTSLAAYNLINYLKEKGHDVNVVCPDKLKSGLDGYYILPQYNLGILNRYIKKNGVVIAKRDMDVISKACEGVDVIHSILPFSVGRAAVKYAKEHNIPITSGFHAQAENATAHVFMMNVKLANRLTYNNLWKHYYKYVDAIHFPTQFICDLVQKYGIKSKHPYVISNGVQTNLFYPKRIKKPVLLSDKFVIIMSGRLSKEKNQMALLKAVKKSKYENKIQIILAGDGPRKSKLVKWGAKNLSNPPIVRRFKHEELADVLRMADLYVHTSIIEIEAISCLEALACGLVPVISNSPRSATSKFSLDKNSSYNYKNIKDLTRKIEYWYEHPKERSDASKMYSEFAKQFDFAKCMEKMEKMLLDISRLHKEKVNG